MHTLPQGSRSESLDMVPSCHAGGIPEPEPGRTAFKLFLKVVSSESQPDSISPMSLPSTESEPILGKAAPTSVQDSIGQQI